MQHVRKIAIAIAIVINCIAMSTRTLADFSLTLSLSGPTQLSANQVAFDVQALFTSTDPADYANSFTVSLDSVDTTSFLKLGTPSNFSRFSFDNFLSGWVGGVDPDFGTGGFSAINAPDYLSQATGNVVLTRLLIDTTGLSANSTYQVSLFDPAVSDASGLISGNPEASLLTAPGGTVSLNASSNFTFTAVPEPSSLFAVMMMGCIGWGATRYRRYRERHSSVSKQPKANQSHEND